jgi:hypothetical protein
MRTKLTSSGSFFTQLCKCGSNPKQPGQPNMKISATSIFPVALLVGCAGAITW